MMPRPHAIIARCSLAISALVAAPALAQDYGIEFVTVRAIGNPPFTYATNPGERNSPVYGRGQVNYEYRIGRYEVTTAQWMEFVNTFNGTLFEDRPPHFDWSGPFEWGAVSDPTYGGPGFRYRLNPNNPNAAMRPVYGISWRMAGLFCNWLHGGKSSDRATLLTGAYDVSTWSTFNGVITDAPTHLPGARFWIPTFDEQVKAFHYDPSHAEHDGWWLDKNMRDVPGVPGPPGQGQTSAYWEDPNEQLGELLIPLGAYPDQLSPWGLLDTSGGVTEWNEHRFPRLGASRERGLTGHSAGGLGTADDVIRGISSNAPDSGGLANGVRIASAAPPAQCVADFDDDGVFENGGTRDGAVTVDDLLFFLRGFEQGNSAVDLDGDGEEPAVPDGGVDIYDLLTFVKRFEQGC